MGQAGKTTAAGEKQESGSRVAAAPPSALPPAPTDPPGPHGMPAATAQASHGGSRKRTSLLDRFKLIARGPAKSAAAAAGERQPAQHAANGAAVASPTGRPPLPTPGAAGSSNQGMLGCFGC